MIVDQLQPLHEKLLDKKIFRLTDADPIYKTYTALNDEAQKKIRNALANGKYMIIFMFGFGIKFWLEMSYEQVHMHVS